MSILGITIMQISLCIVVFFMGATYATWICTKKINKSLNNMLMDLERDYEKDKLNTGFPGVESVPPRKNRGVGLSDNHGMRLCDTDSLVETKSAGGRTIRYIINDPRKHP